MTNDVVAAIGAFFYAGKGPSHSEITRVLAAGGVSDDYARPLDGKTGPNKQERVLNGLNQSIRQGTGRRTLESMLSALRVKECIGVPDGQRSNDEDVLRAALGRAGWYLTDQGELRPFGAADLNTGGRGALDEELDRLRRNTHDPALQLGTAKDLLESVAKYVLEELGITSTGNMSFSALWHVARERLGVLPQNVDTSVPGFEQIRRIHQSTWKIAENVNELRNLQGTGHGHILPTGVTEDMALLVVREACSVAEYMLRQLDHMHGRD